jgi:uncharacterized protein (TIGR03083 family)
MTLPADVDVTTVPQLLRVLSASTQRFVDAVSPRAGSAATSASALEGWSIGTVLAHVWYGAVISCRATVSALAAGEAAFYVGGAEERSWSLSVGDDVAGDVLVEHLIAASDVLQRAWAAMPTHAWDRTFVEPRFGTAALSRLIVLRLTELEVHRTDLDPRLTPEDWLEEFVAVALPLRIAWLAAHHRARHDADISVNGSWALVTEGGSGWTVGATGHAVGIETGIQDDAVQLHGTPHDLLALLLGRPARVGTPQAVARFKRAFPGP